MDMTGGYAKSVRHHATQATICVDPYHVVQLANQALDEVRRAYWNELRSLADPDAAKRFKDARWCLLKRPEKLTDKQTATLARIKAAGGEVWRAYTLKEAVRGIFEAGLSVEDVEVLIKRLLSRLARSRLDPFIRLGKTMRKHRDGILAAIRLGINQGRTEALNNKVRLITRRAYGFHSAPRRTRPDHAHLRTRHPSPPTRTTGAQTSVTLTTFMPREPENGRPITLLGSLQGRRGPHNAPVLDAAGQVRPSDGPAPHFQGLTAPRQPRCRPDRTPATADNAVKRRPPRRSPSATTREPAPTTRAGA